MVYYFWIGTMIMVVAKTIKEAYDKAHLYAEEVDEKEVILMEVL